MLSPGLNINKDLRKQVEINLALDFSSETMKPIRKLLKKSNTCVLALLMLYENRKNLLFEVLT